MARYQGLCVSPAPTRFLNRNMIPLTDAASRGISFGWNTTETEQAGDAMANVIRSDFVATSGYDDLAVYVSYAHGDESREQMYGSNVPRLVQLKKKWDPDDVFRFYHDLATDRAGAPVRV